MANPPRCGLPQIRMTHETPKGCSSLRICSRGLAENVGRAKPARAVSASARSRLPEDVACAGAIDDPGRDEQPVRQAVEIGERRRVEPLRRHRAALGAADDRAGEVERRGTGVAAGQDEAGQRRETGVHRVDLRLEPRDLCRHDAQRAVDPRGRRNVRAEIEQVVLDDAQRRRRRPLAERGDGDADRAVRLVDVADRRHARIGLGDARPVDQPGGAGVAVRV